MYLLKSSSNSITANIIMAFLTIFACSGGKSTLAFVPMAGRRAFSKSTTTITSATAGLRRRRPVYSGESLITLIDKLQREEGKFRDFKNGAFPPKLSSTMLQVATSPDSTTTEQQEESVDLPSVLPFEGTFNEKMRQNAFRMRFAPSPTGSLHVGGARTALYNWLLAKKALQDFPDSLSGFILRIEDTDVARSTKESENSVLEDLRWLGLDWDEGPDMEEAKFGPYRQSERGEIYKQAAKRLLDEGKAYRCFCTKEELEEMKAQQEAKGEVTKYDGRWRDASDEEINKMLDEGKPYTIRFKVHEGSRVVIEDAVRGTVAWDAAATVGDFILLRSSGVPVYNFCVAIDDALMGITTVVRAEEHLTNTVRQALILDALNAPRPQYAHCSLILGEDKQKLSKRHGATSCNQFKLDGFLPDAMINYLALLGWGDGNDNEIFTRDELIDAFELDRVVKSPSVFDMEKLKWVNAQHMKMMSVEKLIPYVIDQLKLEGLLKDDVSADDKKVYEFAFGATSLAKQMMETTKDGAINAKVVLGYNLPKTFADVKDQDAKRMIESGNFYKLSKRVIEDYESGNFPQPNPEMPLAAFMDASGQAIEEDNEKGIACTFTQDYMKYMKSLAKEVGVKGKNLFHPIRLALTGEMSGQDVTKQFSLLAIAARDDSAIDKERAGVVSISERMEHLKSFIETIPEEFREPRSNPADNTKNKKESKDSEKNQNKSIEEKSSGTAPADPLSTYEGPPITALDIRVGRVTKVWEHPEADKLYCEEIDVGEGEPRQIASGLRPYMDATDLEGKKVLVLCNLKARKMVGFESHGMVLCASNEDHSVVKLVNPPIDAKIGERVTVPDFDFDGEEGQPYAENKVGKKKVFEKLAPFLVTSKYGIPEFLGRPFMTSAGACTSPIMEGTVS